MIKVVSKSAKKDTGIMQIRQHALNLINEDRTEAACEQKLLSIRVQQYVYPDDSYCNNHTY